MILLFLGQDSFGKKQAATELAGRLGAQTVFYYEGDEPPRPDLFMEQDLFAKPKLFVLHGKIGAYDFGRWIGPIAQSRNAVVFAEQKMDKRLASTKNLLGNKLVQVREFSIPHGKDFEAWLATRIAELGGRADARTVSLLAVRLGRDETKETKFGGKVVDRTEVYSLWQADAEVRKLIAAGDGAVTAELVQALVPVYTEPDVLQIVNAIGDGNRKQAFEQIGQFLDADGGAGEKEKIIHLNALLSEQFRNVALVQHFLSQNVPESVVLEKTGWKSGRLFILRKIASRFQAKKVLEALDRFSSLDAELKTGSTPPALLLSLIVTQLF